MCHAAQSPHTLKINTSKPSSHKIPEKIRFTVVTVLAVESRVKSHTSSLTGAPVRLVKVSSSYAGKINS